MDRSLISPFLVEVLKIFAQHRVHPQFHALQLIGSTLRMRRFKGFFHAGRILDGRVPSRPCELLPDGDLLLLIERMLHIRGLNTVRISKVKGHADEALVCAGAVRGLDKLGNDGADEAVDFGRRRVFGDLYLARYWC